MFVKNNLDDNFFLSSGKFTSYTPTHAKRNFIIFSLFIKLIRILSIDK